MNSKDSQEITIVGSGKVKLNQEDKFKWLGVTVSDVGVHISESSQSKSEPSME